MASRVQIQGRRAHLPAQPKNGLAPGFTIGTGADGQPAFFFDGVEVPRGTEWQIGDKAARPYQEMTTPPAGTYDPSLDAQLDNANLGFGWAAQDYTLGRQRLNTDYEQAKTDLSTQNGYTLSDLLSARSRAGEDFGTQRTRMGEDFGTSTARLGEDYRFQTSELGRQFTELGDAQSANARAAGVGEGGALAQALAKRQANQGRVQGQLDQGFQRSQFDMQRGFDRGMQDLGTQESRFMTDSQTAEQRQAAGYQRQLSGLDMNYGRQTADMDLTYQRQGIQNTMFGQQVNAQKIWEAQQSGMLPGYPEVTQGGVVYEHLPNGRLVPKRKVGG